MIGVTKGEEWEEVRRNRLWIKVFFSSKPQHRTDKTLINFVTGQYHRARALPSAFWYLLTVSLFVHDNLSDD